MSVPKRKNNINVYPQVELTGRRKELLNKITKSDTFLPDEILHDDLDRGMKDFVMEYFKIVSNDEQIPIIPRILTIQRWGEVSASWEYADDDNNIQIPFISIIRKPDPQPGSNPSVQRTIPDRKLFHYHTIPTWNGTTNGFDIYKIPQPVAVDINYDITIVTNEIRDLNKLNKIVLEKFSSRQSYTIIKGHYIPIVLNTISDSSPINSLETRRFYIQTYSFTLLGLLTDSQEYEVVPGFNRSILTTEFLNTKKLTKNIINKEIDISEIVFISDGQQLTYSVDEIIYELLLVSINGIVQILGNNFYHISDTSKITFINAPLIDDKIIITYISHKNLLLLDKNLNNLLITNKVFIYNGNRVLTFDEEIKDVLYLTINGLVDELNYLYTVSGDSLTLNYDPLIGSKIEVKYIYVFNDLSLSSVYINKYGKFLTVNNEYFLYDGTSLNFITNKKIKDVIYLTVNGIVDEIHKTFSFTNNIITINYEPILNSKIGVSYIT